MAKLKAARVKEAPVVKSMNTSIVKKQRKKRDNKGSSDDVHKNDLKRLSASNEVATGTFTSKENSKKKKKRGNKSDVRDTERSDVPTKYSKDIKKMSEAFREEQIKAGGKIKRKMKNKDKLDAKNMDAPTKYPRGSKTWKTFQEVQVNANSKTKGKKKSNGQKQNVNSDRSNKDAAGVDGAKERKKKLQTFVKKSIDFENKEMKIEKLKKMSEKKMKRMSVEAEGQQINPDKVLKLNKHMIKIRRLEEMLANKSQTKKALKDKITMRLKAARFKFIIEMLYNNNSSQSKRYFKGDPDAFMAYQAGYKWQLEQWAVNPLNVIISSIRKLSTDNVIADFGCGEARLAASVPHTVYSFDFIALNDRVQTCDMAHTPLRMESVDVVVFCLSLMGSNLGDYIIEANRVLKNNGILKIAEIGSRFEDLKDFIKLLRSYGFKNTWKDLSHYLFYFMDFKKEKNINMKKEALPPIMLKASLYKKG